jgi:hypothetical protein
MKSLLNETFQLASWAIAHRFKNCRRPWAMNLGKWRLKSEMYHLSENNG